MKVLHITAHMGGGAGKAIAGMAVTCNQIEGGEHVILLLEKPEKLQHIQKCEENHTRVVIGENEYERNKWIEWADILVISWWQHPKMAEFLAGFPEIPCRVILWCHVNGCVYPYLPYGLLKNVERVLFTTPYSLENPFWTPEQAEEISRKCSMVSGMGEFYPERVSEKKDYASGKRFVIGYVGTLNFAKLHKDYFLYCKKVVEKIPQVRFLMVGEYEDSLPEEAEKLGIREFFEFVGYVDDVYPYLMKMDAFGYLLSADNYATTENAILEAMAMALPIVACKNKPEQYILEEGASGYLVGDAAEYAECMKKLADSSELRKQIGTQARQRVIERYSCTHNRDIFLQNVYLVMQNGKSVHGFRKELGTAPYEWFLFCTGEDRKAFEELLSADVDDEQMKAFFMNCNPIYRELTKSSVSHFAAYYRDDNMLKKLDKVVRDIRNSTPGGKRTPLAAVLPLKAPYLVQIFPVYGCNFRCGYCIHSLERSSHGYISNKSTMDFDFFKKIIDDMKKSNWHIKMLRFAAIGEPLLHRDIAGMVAYAVQADIADSIDIVTNGSLLTRELSDALIEAGLTRLRISLEGLSAKEYKKNAGVDIKFTDFVDNIRYFYENCGKTRLYIKIIDYMVPTPEKQERFYRMFHPICHSLAIEHLTPTVHEIDYNKLSGNRKNNRPQNGEKLIESDICPQPFYMMQVNPDGKVVPCCSMKYPVILGDVMEQSMEEVWLGERYRTFCMDMLDGVQKASSVCGECKLYRYDLHEEDRLDDAALELKEKYRKQEKTEWQR